MGGRLEHEIRLLPQVLSCSFSKDDYVVVLIDPSADTRAIHHEVERILRDAGSQATVRVIGPAEPVEAAATRVVSPLVATATVATVAAIGIGALVGGLAATDHQRTQPPAPRQSLRSAAPSPTDSIDLLRGVQVSAAGIVTGVPVPPEVPDHTLRALPVSHGASVEAVSLTRAQPPVHPTDARKPSNNDVEEPARGEHGNHGHHRGKGPRSWSNSVLLSGRDHHGKGTRG